MHESIYSGSKTNQQFCSSPLHGCEALIIESDPNFRAILAEALHIAGAEITTAENLVSAQFALNQHRPTLILSASRLVDGTPCNLIRNLRQQERLETQFSNQTPIAAIALLSLAHEHNCSNLLTAGFDVPLSRPIEPRQLIRIIVETMAVINHHQPTQQQWANEHQINTYDLATCL